MIHRLHLDADFAALDTALLTVPGAAEHIGQQLLSALVSLASYREAEAIAPFGVTITLAGEVEE